MILAKIDMQYLLTELGSMMPSGFRFTSLLAIISDLVTVGTFLFPVISPYFFSIMGVFMVPITNVFVWCGITALRVEFCGQI